MSKNAKMPDEQSSLASALYSCLVASEVSGISSHDGKYVTKCSYRAQSGPSGGIKRVIPTYICELVKVRAPVLFSSHDRKHAFKMIVEEEVELVGH